jgi:hypothetical protein
MTRYDQNMPQKKTKRILLSSTILLFLWVDLPQLHSLENFPGTSIDQPGLDQQPLSTLLHVLYYFLSLFHFFHFMSFYFILFHFIPFLGHWTMTWQVTDNWHDRWQWQIDFKLNHVFWIWINRPTNIILLITTLKGNLV